MQQPIGKEIRIWEATIIVADRYGNRHGSENFTHDDCNESEAREAFENDACELLEAFNIAGSAAVVIIEGLYYDAAQDEHFIGAKDKFNVEYKDADYERGEDR